MTDEQSLPLKDGKAKRCKRNDFYTIRRRVRPPPLLEGRRRPTSYRRRKDIHIKILQALAWGKHSGWIIEHINEPDRPNLTKSHIQYWKNIGLEKGIIIRLRTNEDDRRRVIYGIGPNYHLLSYVGVQGEHFAPFLCRVHSPGNAVTATIDCVDWAGPYEIALTHLGHTKRFKLERSKSIPAYWVTFQFLIPQDVIGYYGAKSTIFFNHQPTRNKDTIAISPPEVLLTLDQLEGKIPWVLSFPECLDPSYFGPGHEDDPYRNVVEYILSVFRANGWEFKGWENNEQFHYAFCYQDVKDFNIGLLDDVPRLSEEKSWDELPTIWIDRSGGKWELETSSKWVAIEMMTILELSRKRFTGERKLPEGWGESLFMEVDQ